MSVDTYIGRRNTSNYSVVQQDGVEVLVSKVLAPYIRNIAMDCHKFLFMNKLEAELELRNGLIVAT